MPTVPETARSSRPSGFGKKLHRYAEPFTEVDRLSSQPASDVRANREVLFSFVSELAVVARLQDPYTASHENRVAALACAIAREMNWSDRQIHVLRFAALFHDIGKIVIPARILHKSGPMPQSEMEFIREHAQLGYEILRCIPHAQPIAEIVYQHHERLDGSGYPRGLKRDAILPEAKVLAVADVVDAIASARSYRRALGIETARNVIENQAGRQLDEEAVFACVTLMHTGRLVAATPMQGRFDSKPTSLYRSRRSKAH
jgi:putative nucleotidyltransferase with HDIG domain